MWHHHVSPALGVSAPKNAADSTFTMERLVCFPWLPSSEGATLLPLLCPAQIGYLLAVDGIRDELWVLEFLPGHSLFPLCC